MDPALFSAGNLFAGDSDSEDSADSAGDRAFVERDHEFPGMVLKIREFAFHQVNANLLWPGTRNFAEWLVKHPTLLSGLRILELGRGVDNFLRKMYDLDITTSDYDDEDIENNIYHNHVANDISASPHIRHTWGDKFPSECSEWDLIIASDILLYVKQYSNLVKTLVFLLETWKPKATGINTLSPGSRAIADGSLQAGVQLGLNLREEIHSDKRNNVVNVPYSLPKPCFLMSWRRRIPKEDEDLFFHGCKASGQRYMASAPKCRAWGRNVETAYIDRLGVDYSSPGGDLLRKLRCNEDSDAHVSMLSFGRLAFGLGITVIAYSLTHGIMRIIRRA